MPKQFIKFFLFSSGAALAGVLLLGCLIMGPEPVAAKFITVHDIPSGIPTDMPYGEVVREIRIEGNKYTKEYVIRWALKSVVGQVYTEENAKMDFLWVLRTGTFTAVSFSSEILDNGMVLIVTVTEGTPYIPSISIALTQENGFEIGPAVSSSNLFGTGARASIYARFGGATNIGIKFADPMLRVPNLLHGHRFEYFHRERTNELQAFEETTDEIFYELNQASNDETRHGFRFHYMALKSDTDGITLGSDNYDHVPGLGIFVQTDSRNSVYPTRGWYFDLEVAKYGLFGGDSDYWRFDVDGRHYTKIPFLGEKHSMAFSTYASLQTGVVGQTLPSYSAFWIGGTNSVRGWSLGSRQGKNQWLTTLEYWYRLMDQKIWKIWFIKMRLGFQIGAFYDVGTAWYETEEMDQNWIGGGGVGFRLTLPVVTMVRFDMAMGEDDFGVRIFIGGGEKALAQKQRVR